MDDNDFVTAICLTFVAVIAILLLYATGVENTNKSKIETCIKAGHHAVIEDGNLKECR